MDEMIGIALRISIMYLYVLALLRLSGKRSISSISPLDFAVSVLVGDLFDDVFWAEVPLAQGMVAFSTILFLNTLVALIEYRSDAFHRLVSGTPTPVIKDGLLLERGQSSERTSTDDVLSSLRLLGEDQVQQVKEANWEPHGKLSLIHKEEAKPVQKMDLEAFRKQVIQERKK